MWIAEFPTLLHGISFVLVSFLFAPRGMKLCNVLDQFFLHIYSISVPQLFVPFVR